MRRPSICGDVVTHDEIRRALWGDTRHVNFQHNSRASADPVRHLAPPALAADVARALRPQGRVAVIDFAPGMLWFHAADHGVRPNAVVGAFQAAGEPGAAIVSYAREHAAGVFERRTDTEAWVLAIDVRGDPMLRWRAGLNVAGLRRLDGALLVTAMRATK